MDIARLILASIFLCWGVGLYVLSYILYDDRARTSYIQRVFGAMLMTAAVFLIGV